MKTCISKITIAVISFITLTFLLTHTADLAGKDASHQTSAIYPGQPRPVIPGQSYSEVINGLFTSSGR